MPPRGRERDHHPGRCNFRSLRNYWAHMAAGIGFLSGQIVNVGHTHRGLSLSRDGDVGKWFLNPAPGRRRADLVVLPAALHASVVAAQRHRHSLFLHTEWRMESAVFVGEIEFCPGMVKGDWKIRSRRAVAATRPRHQPCKLYLACEPAYLPPRNSLLRDRRVILRRLIERDDRAG